MYIEDKDQILDLDEDKKTRTMHDPDYRIISKDPKNLIPLVHDVNEFNLECPKFVENQEIVCKEPFMLDVAQPMMLAYRHYNDGNHAKAMEAAKSVQSLDWQIAAVQWLKRRKGK
jgi:hypothetical protein